MNIKTFSIHAVRNVFAFFIALGLGYVAYTVNPTSVAPMKVEAGVADNVTGYAWSENVGWISLNSTSDGSATSYGVNVSPVATTGTGTFSGYAWSENVGWISFTSTDLSICPVGASVAQVDWTTGKITGWARALNGSATSGWDGCIKFSDDTNSFWNGRGVKISLVDGTFSGYAWGGDVIGWIDFAPTVGGLPISNKAKIPLPCTASNPSIVWGACDATASCVSGGTVTQTGLTGIQSGSCTDGSSGTVVQSCTAATTDCSTYASTHPGTYIIGDGICSSPMENSTNSLTDCKPATKFWQF